MSISLLCKIIHKFPKTSKILYEFQQNFLKFGNRRIAESRPYSKLLCQTCSVYIAPIMQ